MWGQWNASWSFSLGCRDADGLDDVAQIAGRIPQRIHRLHVAGIVGGANLEFVGAGLEFYGKLPFPERVFAQILAELCRRPVLAAIGRDRDFLDALAAVEGDALQRRWTP